ncbi:hypothetical protein QE152_g37081 [Popillia japonica]|uniref:Uncharacterized protein n=1 Tax=Popillia japonica TaxID=7064 RepID=A0AAW1IAM7_POPJA
MGVKCGGIYAYVVPIFARGFYTNEKDQPVSVKSTSFGEFIYSRRRQVEIVENEGCSRFYFRKNEDDV